MTRTGRLFAVTAVLLLLPALALAQPPFRIGDTVVGFTDEQRSLDARGTSSTDRRSIVELNLKF
jgi:hypothetical protein